MKRQLSFLSNLRTFELVSRLDNFTAAAAELNLTQSAVSHQIRVLEDALQVSLFERTTRRVTLTAEGEVLARSVRTALIQIDETVHRISPSFKADRLTVSVTPSFAAKWLTPRLPRFAAKYPEINLRILANDRLVDFTDADLAIHFGGGSHPGLHCELLLQEQVFPVCSPSLPVVSDDIDSIETIALCRLLHYDGGEDMPGGYSWMDWLRKSGLAGVGKGLDDLALEQYITSGHHHFYSHVLLCIQAATSGLGIALGWRSLVEQELADGRLIKLGTKATTLEYSYYLVAPLFAFSNPDVAKFRAWLFEEVSCKQALGASQNQRTAK